MPQHNRLILTDLLWSSYSTPDVFLTELLLLSLVYDEIFLPEEYLVLNNRIARLFSQPQDVDLLKPFFESGVLKVLGMPPRGYVRPSDLELSGKHPLLARAQHIQFASTKEAKPFKPTKYQDAFYPLFDAALVGHDKSRKPVVERFAPGGMSVLLRTILEQGAYRNVQHKTFRN